MTSLVIIVSDSGPLAYLVQIGLADNLPKLYGKVYVPPTVMSELRHARSPVVSWAGQLPDWLTIAAPQSLPRHLKLDEGEREAIGLALELRGRLSPDGRTKGTRHQNHSASR